MKQVNVRLKEEMHRQAKVIAVLKDTTLSEYLEQAIERAIESDKKLLKKIK
jgi:predicted HicB family RNase H-like nuclease